MEQLVRQIVNVKVIIAILIMMELMVMLLLVQLKSFVSLALKQMRHLVMEERIAILQLWYVKSVLLIQIVHQ